MPGLEPLQIKQTDGI